MAFDSVVRKVSLTLGVVLACAGMVACSTVPHDEPSWSEADVPPPPPPPNVQVLQDWRAVITPQDRDRYERRAEAWRLALEQARSQSGSGDLEAVAYLIDPAAALENPVPEVGNYRCRTVKLGNRSGEGGLGYVVYGWFACRIDNTPQGLKLTKLTGSQRVSGLFYPENRRHMLLIGTMQLGNEQRAPTYGSNLERDVVSVVERIGTTRWRLVTPWPQVESNLDILELERL